MLHLGNYIFAEPEGKNEDDVAGAAAAVENQ